MRNGDLLFLRWPGRQIYLLKYAIVQILTDINRVIPLHNGSVVRPNFLVFRGHVYSSRSGLSEFLKVILVLQFAFKGLFFFIYVSLS